MAKEPAKYNFGCFRWNSSMIGVIASATVWPLWHGIWKNEEKLKKLTYDWQWTKLKKKF